MSHLVKFSYLRISGFGLFEHTITVFLFPPVSMAELSTAHFQQTLLLLKSPGLIFNSILLLFVCQTSNYVAPNNHLQMEMVTKKIIFFAKDFIHIESSWEGDRQNMEPGKKISSSDFW